MFARDTGWYTTARSAKSLASYGTAVHVSLYVLFFFDRDVLLRFSSLFCDHRLNYREMSQCHNPS